MNQLIQKTLNFCREQRNSLWKTGLIFMVIFTLLRFSLQKITEKINQPILALIEKSGAQITPQQLMQDGTSELYFKQLQSFLPELCIILILLAFFQFIYHCSLVLNAGKTDGKLSADSKLPSILPMFTTFILLSIMCNIGLLLCILPGIILRIFLLMVPCALVLDHRTNFASFDQSFAMMKKNLSDTLFSVLLFGAVYVCFLLGIPLFLNLIETFFSLIPVKIFGAATQEFMKNIFLLSSAFFESALYVIFMPMIQNVLYLQYTKQSTDASDNPQMQDKNQPPAQHKYTLEDYYRGKEESPEDDDDSKDSIDDSKE